MTASEDRIEELVRTVPTIQRTRSQKFWRAVSILCNVVAVVTLALYVIGSVQTRDLANCTNSNLGTRSTPAANDAKAHIAFAESVLNLFNTEPRVTPQRRAAEFQHATKQYVTVLIHDQKLRDAHPLGKC